MSRPAHVLLVSDDDNTASLAVDLIAAGHTVTLAQQHADALPLATQQPWDAVVIDVQTLQPALKLLHELQGRGLRLAAIMLADTHDTTAIEAALLAGAYDWLPRPCPLPLLLAAVARAAERRDLGRAAAAPDDARTRALVHDINNQLGGIIGLIQLYSDDDRVPADLRADLDMMLQSARAIRDLLRSIKAS
jgi:DNA-binding NtrC family response regulator